MHICVLIECEITFLPPSQLDIDLIMKMGQQINIHLLVGQSVNCNDIISNVGFESEDVCVFVCMCKIISALLHFLTG